MRRKVLLSAVFAFCTSFGFCAGTKVYPAHWLFGGDVSQYTSPYKGNVILPPYYHEYIDGADYRAQKCWIVCGISGSFHDGTWVQARRRAENVTRASYQDGPFKDADIDTLRLPHTINKIGDFAFENGKVKVLIIGAQVPPEFSAVESTPVFQAKLIVPTGSLNAYKSHDSWGKFSKIEEGAEGYFPAQMVQLDGAWYEIYHGEGKLISSEGVRGTLEVPDNIEYYSAGYPVTELSESSVYRYDVKTLRIGANVRSFSADCVPSVTENIDWYASRKIVLDSIFVSDDNPYLASAGGAVFTKDYKELIYLPLERQNSVNSRMFTLPFETNLIRDNAFATRTYHDDFLISMTIYISNPSITIGDNSKADGSVYFVYLQNLIPNILAEGQLPIRGANWAAYWMVDTNSFDLQYLVNGGETNLSFPSEFDYGPMKGMVKTIGKYGQYGDDELRRFGFYKGTNNTKAFFQLNNKKTAKAVTIPEGVEEIYGVFEGVSTLTEVSLPQSLKVIGYESFRSCKTLESITIPQNVEIIGTNAFAYCSKLANIYLECTVPPTFSDQSSTMSDVNYTYSQIFNGLPSSAVLHVPTGYKQIYTESPVWKDFTNIIDDVQTGISNIETNSQRKPLSVWSIDGRKGRHQGLNIIRYNDGTVRKVIIK